MILSPSDSSSEEDESDYFSEEEEYTDEYLHWLVESEIIYGKPTLSPANVSDKLMISMEHEESVVDERLFHLAWQYNLGEDIKVYRILKNYYDC